MPVVRDSTFFRAVADNFFVTYLGRDFEIACVQSSPTIGAIRESGDGVAEVLTFPAEVEVARIRTSRAAAFNLAMGILTNAVEEGFVDRAKLIEAFSEVEE